MSNTPRTAPTAGRRRLLISIAGLAGIVLVIDQLTKAWAEAALADGDRITVVGDLLGFVLVYNPGAALSLATGMTWVLTIIATAVVVVIVRASRRIGSRGWALALGLLLGGAVGNLVDRFAREPGFARGHVVDFIAYGDLFVGNVADIAIVAAAGAIIVLSLRGIRLDGTRESDDVPAGPVDASDLAQPADPPQPAAHAQPTSPAEPAAPHEPPAPSDLAAGSAPTDQRSPRG